MAIGLADGQVGEDPVAVGPVVVDAPVGVDAPVVEVTLHRRRTSQRRSRASRFRGRS